MKALNRFAKKRLSRLTSLLKSYDEGTEQHVLHKVRVEIKKIRTLQNLINASKKKYISKEAYAPFREIFKACAVLRERYVLQELEEKYLKRKIRPSERNEQQLAAFGENLPGYLKTVRKHGKKLLHDLQSVSKKEYSRRMKELRTELYEQFRDRLSNDELHDLRKKVKEYLYLSAVTQSEQEMDQSLLQIADMIGEWHDRMIFQERLQEKAPRRKAVIKKLENQCRSDVRRLKVAFRKWKG